MFDDFEKLYEDAAMYGNKWTGGIANRSLKPEQITIADALKDSERRLKDDKVGNVNPYPSQGIEEKIGDAFLRLEEIRILLDQTLQNPLVKDTTENRVGVRQAIKDIKAAEKSLKTAVKTLDKIMN